MAQFLSTPSARRATFFGKPLDGALLISIHALREEGDDLTAMLRSVLEGFLSTPSARRATAGAVHGTVRRPISIHALREEGDGSRCA